MEGFKNWIGLLAFIGIISGCVGSSFDSENIGWIVFFTITIGIIIICKILDAKADAQKEELWTAYQNALQGNSKAHAIQCGREYYSYINDGRVSLIHEQMIQTDISGMND